MLCRFPALPYYIGHDSMIFGDHWVSGSFEGAMHAPLHVLVVLLCSVYRVFSCRSPFLGSPISPPPHCFNSRGFSTVLPVQCDGCWGWVFLAGRARGLGYK